VKARLKFIAPRAEGQAWWWGANFEIGHVNHKLDVNPWNAELKGIVGTRLNKWTLAENANVDFVVSGPQPHSPEVEFDTKLAYAMTKAVSLGVESYNGTGSFAHFGAVGKATSRSLPLRTSIWAIGRSISGSVADMAQIPTI
jgi:hypothetical protein